MTLEGMEEALNVPKTKWFGKTKCFINRHTFDINNLLKEDKDPKNDLYKT